jgi:hypothetical protein
MILIKPNSLEQFNLKDNMYTVWTKNLKTDQEKDNFNNQLLGARPVLERLMELLNEKEYSLESSERSVKAYETPNWAFLQAHKNGCASMLTSIKELINLDQQRVQ